MDNYFTLPKVIADLREEDIGVVGTSRFRKTWPSNHLKDKNKDNPEGLPSGVAKFNDFFWTVDQHGTLCG